MILGALRFGKPFVLDMMSLELEQEAIEGLFDAVYPGLLKLILSRKIRQEQYWRQLITDADDEQYQPTFWLEKITARFQFVLLSRLPLPPEWCAEGFFVMRVSS